MMLALALLGILLACIAAWCWPPHFHPLHCEQCGADLSGQTIVQTSSGQYLTCPRCNTRYGWIG